MQEHVSSEAFSLSLWRPHLCSLPRPSSHQAPVLVPTLPIQGAGPFEVDFLGRIIMIITHFICIVNYHLQNWFIPVNKLSVEKVHILRSVSPSPPSLSCPLSGISSQGQVLSRWPCPPELCR